MSAMASRRLVTGSATATCSALSDREHYGEAKDERQRDDGGEECGLTPRIAAVGFVPAVENTHSFLFPLEPLDLRARLFDGALLARGHYLLSSAVPCCSSSMARICSTRAFIRSMSSADCWLWRWTRKVVSTTVPTIWRNSDCQF